MKKAITAVVLILSFFVAPMASAAQIDDALVAYYRGDYTNALKRLTPLAKQGEVIAQSLLGDMYFNGQGVTQNYKEAANWYRLAILNNGNIRALRSLGRMYYEGKGVIQNYSEVARLWHLAASGGDYTSMGLLGILYFEGHGVTQNYIKAHMWVNLEKSSNTQNDEGNQFGQKMIGQIEKRMTREQIAEAQEMARKCQASNFKQCD